MKIVYSVKTQHAAATIKDVDGKKGIVTGYFSNFGNVDSDGDIIRPGAFTKSINERGPKSSAPRIKHLMNHDVNKPLGKLTELFEDQKGLLYTSETGSHTLGQDFIKMVESGLITEHSIGFATIKRNQLQDYEGYAKNPAKGWYEITEAKLWEGSSLTGWGANELTPLLGMKGVTDDDIKKFTERNEALEKFCRNSTASDETIEMLLIETKQLTQIICDFKNTTKPKDQNTLPENGDAWLKALTKFINA